jgi:replicative DNA helicase
MMMMPDRLPPVNIECERGVLGSILCDQTVIYEVMPVLDVEDFYRDAHQTIYRAARKLADSGQAVDAFTIGEAMARSGELEQVGGEEFLGELAACVPHTANAIHYADIVKQKAISRRLIEEATAVLRDIYSNQFTAEQLIASSQARFLAVGDHSHHSEVSLREATDRALATMDRRWKGEDPGVRLPFPEIDRCIDGFRPGRFYIVGGRPGSGKSAFLFNVADHAALNPIGPSVRVLFFSLEMDAEEQGERYLSSRAGVNGYGFRRPQELKKGPVDAIYREHAAATDSLLRIDEAGGLTLAAIAARARRHKNKFGLGIIFIDYIQLIDGGKAKGENRQEEVARVSRGLKLLAKELKVPVVAAAQLNRAMENRPAADQIPRMSDLRESGQMDADAHAVLLFHAPTDQNDLVNVIVAKNRGGSVGTIPLTFTRPYTRFEPYDPNRGYVPPPVNGAVHDDEKAF